LSQPVSLVVVIGALSGLAGITLIFIPEFNDFDINGSSLAGVGLSLLGTFVASIGNIISARNQRHNIPVIQANAYGMAYGALILLAAALWQGYPLSFELSMGYSISLLYLSLFGSVLAFGSYLTLVGRIGPDKAAYTMVLFPLVALGISTLFEGYQWTLISVAGVALVLLGNVIIIMPKAYFHKLVAIKGKI